MNYAHAYMYVNVYYMRWRERERWGPPLLQDNSKGAVNVITQATNQLSNVATLPARPLILTGRICVGEKIRYSLLQSRKSKQKSHSQNARLYYSINMVPQTL